MITTFKAQETGKETVPDLHIVATEAISPDRSSSEWHKQWSATLDAEALKIVNALAESLPGGVLARIHAIMTKRYENALAVTWGDMKQQ